NGQRRLVLISDGNENLGDAVSALSSALPLGVELQVVPLGAARAGDVSLQKLALPPTVKKGQTFETKIFVQSDRARPAALRLYRNDQFLGEQNVELNEGKNLFTFPQTLSEAGFYSYNAVVDSPGDSIAQNNRASSFTSVRGEPRALLISSSPDQDAPLVEALRAAKLDVRVVDATGFPATLAELQSYDTVFLSNIAAGDLGTELLKLLESAVRDFGVGLVCVGGEQTYLAGGYKGTPLETTLPVNMELDSKKVLPRGALVIVMHATEYPGGNQWARDIAFAALESLGREDEMGIVFWDGRQSEKWLFELSRVGDKKEKGQFISGMNPGDMPAFEPPMRMAHDGLKKSTANLKHMVVFSDGDPKAPEKPTLDGIVADRITISTVMIGGHTMPDNMMMMADVGKGRFYDVRSPSQLPQIFIKEAAVILRSAIFEEPFKPQLAASSELVRGIGALEFPPMLGYVVTTPKPRAETPLVTAKGDPLLAHWQFGLGRAVAFTSDAKAKWARDWLGWARYRQFWGQVAQWSLRRVAAADLQAEVAVENGEGALSVEALDAQGNYRNFLTLDAVVVSPKGGRQTVRLQQTGAGRYEAKFPMREVGAYLVNLMDVAEGQVRGVQAVGASINYSPEFDTSGANLSLLQRLAELGKGHLLDPKKPEDNPFLIDRRKTFRPEELWEWLLRFAVVLFVLDVGVRRIDIGREEWAKAWHVVRRGVLFWRKQPVVVKQDESLAALLARREAVRAQTPVAIADVRPELFHPVQAPVAAEPVTEIGAGPKKEDKTGGTDAPGAAPSAGTKSTASRLLEAKRRAGGGSPKN
ncbi:MAG TPA: glutamine amidotransferase, partial [Verrucomicrobiae bacterium]